MNRIVNEWNKLGEEKALAESIKKSLEKGPHECETPSPYAKISYHTHSFL